MKSRAIHFILALGLILTAAQAAETTSVVPDSAQALATVGGRFANLHDASAVRVAPANMLQIKQPEVLLNAAVWNGDIRFDSTTSGSVKMSQSWIYPGSIYAVLPVVPDRLAFGFGISTPFGLGTPYSKNMPVGLRYNVAYEAKLLAVDFTPAVPFV